MSDPSVTTILADLLLYRHELSEHDRDVVDMLDLANEAGESISARNYSRITALYKLHKGVPLDE